MLGRKTPRKSRRRIARSCRINAIRIAAPAVPLGKYQPGPAGSPPRALAQPSLLVFAAAILRERPPPAQAASAPPVGPAKGESRHCCDVAYLLCAPARG